MSPDDVEHDDVRPQRQSFAWRVLPLATLLLGTILFFALGLHRYLSFEELGRHREALVAWRDRNQTLAVLVFVLSYLAVTALSVPGAVWMTICGGFLFGVVAGSVYAVIAATLGSCVVFLAARLVASDWLRRRAGAGITGMEAGFRRNALSYLLVLRLIPIFPFWLVNLVPALLGVRFTTFFIGTLVGIIPGSVVYASIGHGLDAMIATGKAPDLDVLFRPQVLAPLVGLALLALLPAAYRRIKRGDAAGRSDGEGQ